jgi:hypothetical protein
MSDPVRQVFADWSLPLWLTLSIAITAAIYLRGWILIRKTRPAQFDDTRIGSFLSASPSSGSPSPRPWTASPTRC